MKKWPSAIKSVKMPSELPVHALDKFVLRLPEGMRDKIGAVARVNKRTMNAEIVTRLENSFLDAERPAAAVTASNLDANISDLRDQVRLLTSAIADIRALLIGQEPGVPDFVTKSNVGTDEDN